MEDQKCCNKVCGVLAVIGAIVFIAAIAYAVVKFCMPDYLEDFDDFDDDDFDDFEDEDAEKAEEEAAVETATVEE